MQDLGPWGEDDHEKGGGTTVTKNTTGNTLINGTINY